MITQEQINKDRETAIEHATKNGGLLILVMAQHEVRYYIPADYEVCISIATENMRGSVCDLSKFMDVLRLDFDDVMHVMDNGESISETQAKQVAEFVYKHLDKKRLIIHCFAGISRSRSMAAAITAHLHVKSLYTALNKDVETKVYNALEDYYDGLAADMRALD